MEYEHKTLWAEGRGLSTGIETYQGPWNSEQHQHLLRRTLFGVKKSELDTISKMTVEDAVNLLLQEAPEPPLPVNDYNREDFKDPVVKLGETWIYETGREDSDLVSQRVIALKTWWIKQIINQPLSLHEKMVYFWHNHLATQSWDVFWPHLSYYHFTTLRNHAFGNFRDMVKAFTIDPHTLIYLNGAANNKYAPDENYARELQELFCVGKGPEAKFTESDVQEMSRVLTGHSIDWEDGGKYLYRPYWHDEGDKQFSSFYSNTTIKGRSGMAGKDELDDLLTMIFDTGEVANFVVRKIYRFFVHTVIDDQAEQEVIQPLAKIFRDGNYEIKPVLQVLLTSAHFYDSANVGASIKSPLDFLLGFWRSFEVTMPLEATVQNESEIRSSMLWNMGNIGLEVMDPPNVAGYPAYYQIPQYDKHWITTNTITNRAVTTDSFIYWGFWSVNLLTNVDLIGHLKTLDHPEDPVMLANEIVDRHFGIKVSDPVIQRVRGILLTGQNNDSYWTNAWFDHLDDPSNQMKRDIVESRLKVAMQFLLQRAEYQLF